MSIKEMLIASLFSALTCIGALIAIPIGLVPITLQVLVTLSAGALLGKKVGAVSQLVYVLLGIVGLPVFAQGKSGIGVLFGPTGGFLIGFIVSAYMVGLIIEKLDKRAKNSFLQILLISGSMFIGLMIIYGLGILRLAIEYDFLQALTYGFFPFIVPDFLKMVIGVTFVLAIKKPLVKAGYLTV